MATTKKTAKKTARKKAARKTASQKAEPKKPAISGGTRKRTAARLTEASKLRIVRGLIARLHERMEEEDGLKGSLSDLIRLLQLEKELAPDRPHKITVQWVDPEPERAQ
jgi:hypothetical protein